MPTLFFDETAALASLAGNHSLLIDIARIFCEDAPTDLACLGISLLANDTNHARLAARKLADTFTTFHVLYGLDIVSLVETCILRPSNSLEFLHKLEAQINWLIGQFKIRKWVT